MGKVIVFFKFNLCLLLQYICLHIDIHNNIGFNIRSFLTRNCRNYWFVFLAALKKHWFYELKLQICWPLTVTWQSQILMLLLMLLLVGCVSTGMPILFFKKFLWDLCWRDLIRSYFSWIVFKSVSDFELDSDIWVWEPEKIQIHFYDSFLNWLKMWTKN